MCREGVAVHFDIILELVNNVKAAQIPYNKKYECFALDIESRLYYHIISRESLHATL
jgi:hypothetical protein